MGNVILIPAYNPDERLENLVDELLAGGKSEVIVVNDGSKAECGPLFDRLRTKKGCVVLGHAVNGGKGRALKTGMEYFLSNFPGTAGLVTADADGQHLAVDILSVCRKLEAVERTLVLGVRAFGKGTPLRSILGNRITSFVFGLLLGRGCSDTQTGLRGIGAGLIPEFLTIPGDRFEYELDMLLYCITERIPFAEVPIRTVYLEGNKSSHFNPLKDSWRIYSRIFRFLFSMRRDRRRQGDG